jgi:hypothetical protein
MLRRRQEKRMKKIIVEFQNGKILPALLTDGEELSFRFCRKWRKVKLNIDPSHLERLMFSEFAKLKFFDRVRLLFWKDHYPDPPIPPPDPVDVFFSYFEAFRAL